ncbi:SdpI family protein [Flagellimonas lutaonensis]
MGFGNFLASIVFGFLILVCGIIWQKFPPKKINYLYGYRTRRSMANQQIWKYANRIGANMFVWLGIVLTVFGILIYVLWPKSAVIISLFVMLLGMGVGIYWCETQLNRDFDKNGNPKSNR